MYYHLQTAKALVAVSAIALLASCSKPDNSSTVTPQLRQSVDYTKLTDTTTYANFFVDNSGAKTVDVTAGTNRLRMFRLMNTYSSTSISSNTAIDFTTLNNMFANTSSPFSGTDASLNTSGVNVRDVTALSLTAADATKERQTIVSSFSALAASTKAVSATAVEGKAGKLGIYLVDERGIEWNQVVQKGLIGAFQLDYITNVLLSDANLALDNSTLVAGKNYTAREQNWDQIYGVLTTNRIYGVNSTSATSGESFVGSYIWEYNNADFSKIHPALLKGRAAIVNNDATTLKAQATILRGALEKAVANSALGYLGKWKTAGTNTAAAAHAIGEGIGFIYGLRYAKMGGGDAAFSDGVLNNLVYSAPNGFWGLTNAKIDAATAAIKAKFTMYSL